MQVIPSLDPGYGGPAQGARQIAMLLGDRGHEPHIATLEPEGEAWLHDSGVTHHGFESRGEYRLSPAFVRWLRGARHAFDVVIVHGLWSFPTLGTYLGLRGNAHTPYVVFPHGMLDPWFKRENAAKHVKKFAYWTLTERRTLRDANAVIFTCDEERRLARESFKTYDVREYVSGYGIRAPALARAAAHVEAFRTAHALVGRRVLLYLGRLHSKKRPDVALKAFSRVAADPDIVLVMAGDGDAGYVRSLMGFAASLGVSDRVRWVGLLTGDDKWAALLTAELMLLPSEQENFGLVLAEACAAGTPAVTTRGVNIWPEIERGGGLIASTSGEFISLLEGAVAWTEAERSARGDAARAAFERDFLLDRAVDSLERLLLEATSGARDEI